MSSVTQAEAVGIVPAGCNEDSSDPIPIRSELAEQNDLLSTLEFEEVPLPLTDMVLSLGVDGPREVLYDPSFEKDEKWLEWIAEEFLNISGPEEIIGLRDFKNILGLKSDQFSERMFSMFDTDKTGFLTLEQFLRGIATLAHGTRKEKILFLFKAWDLNGNQFLDTAEIRKIIMSCSEECNILLTEELVKMFTNELFAFLDTDHDGVICFTELTNALQHYPTIYKYLKLNYSDLFKDIRKKEQLNWEMRKHKPWYLVWAGSLCGITSILLYLATSVCGVTIFFYYNYETGLLYCIAHSTGHLFSFNMGLVVLFSLKHFWTFKMISRIIPFAPPTMNFTFHRVLVYITSIYGALHSFTITGQLYKNIVNENVNSTDLGNRSSEIIGKALFDELFDPSKQGCYFCGVTAGFIFILLLVLGHGFLRAFHHIDIYQLCHLMYLLLWIFLSLHSHHFWKFMLVPWFLFSIDKIYPLLTRQLSQLKLKEVEMLPNRVVLLVFERPNNFYFSPGDFIYLKIPQISWLEWHAMYITSSPFVKKEIWVHVVAAGEWTHTIYKTCKHINFGKKTYNSRVASVLLPTDGTCPITEKQMATKKPFTAVAFVDGPYVSSSTLQVLSTTHVVLIAYGSGIFGFLSLIDSLMKHSCNPKKSVINKWKKANLTVKKIELFWVAHDHSSLQWCLKILQDVEKNDPPESGLFNIQIYLTSARGLKDYRGVAVQVAVHTLYLREKIDFLTGLRSLINPGQPHWDQILKELKQNKCGPMTVFYCGPNHHGEAVSNVCKQLELSFSLFL